MSNVQNTFCKRMGCCKHLKICQSILNKHDKCWTYVRFSNKAKTNWEEFVTSQSCKNEHILGVIEDSKENDVFIN